LNSSQRTGYALLCGQVASSACAIVHSYKLLTFLLARHIEKLRELSQLSM